MESLRWRNELIRAQVERDLLLLAPRTSSTAMRRCWMMLAHFHGQTWNAAELVRSRGSDEGYLDLLVVKDGKRLGFEVKLTEAPSLTPAMRSAMQTLKLDSLEVVHAGTQEFPLAERVRAVPLGHMGRT